MNILKDEYDVEVLNPRRNPYAKKLKKQITIHLDGSTIDCVKCILAICPFFLSS